MPRRAQDIQELEDLRHAGASSEELSDKAIEICKRLQHEIRSVRHGSRRFSAPDLELERQDFEELLAEIWNARPDGVLDKYIKHVQTYGGPRDG